MGQVISLAQALRLRQNLRQHGKTLVFTNGVFDLLHVGHVHYLQAARRLGHVLLVGLNTDRSASQLKGPYRPLVPQEERADVLCALACVDYVVLFDEPTAEHVIATLQPDVYVKGGDYAAEEDATHREGKMLPEAPAVRSYGGRVVIVPLAPGHSTTDLIARISRMAASHHRTGGETCGSQQPAASSQQPAEGD